jgi:hypothetical protein
MYVSRENERLYLTSWEYNAARVLARLEKIVSDNGGSVIVRDYNRYALISDRTLTACVKDAVDMVDSIRLSLDMHADNGDGKNEGRRAVLAERLAKLEHYQSIDNTPIRCRWFTYISFVLDGVYYSVSLDDNMFFPFTYQKIKLNSDNTYIGDYYAETLTKEWLFDSLLRCGCSEDDIKEAANMIFNSLCNGKFSGRCPADRERRRVPNVYDGGYHYETIVKPGRVHRPLVSVID